MNLPGPARRLLFAWNLAVFSTSVAVVVTASSPAGAADYDSLLREGIGLRRSGDDASALKRFEQAYEINPTPRALAQMGLAEQALGRWTAADKHLREAVTRGDSWIHKNRVTIDRALSLISAHVGQLAIEGTPVGAEVRVDGETVGRLPLSRPVTVAAGGVAIEVRASGYLAIVRTPIVGAQTLTRESINLQPLPTPVAVLATPPPPTPSTTSADGAASASSSGGAEGGEHGAAAAGSDPSPSEQRESSGLRRGLTLGAVGLSAVSLGLGIVEHLIWQNRANSFGAPKSGCGTTLANLGASGCQQLFNDGRRARTLAFVGYGLAGAFAITALIIHLTGPDTVNDRQEVACGPLVPTPGLMCAYAF